MFNAFTQYREIHLAWKRPWNMQAQVNIVTVKQELKWILFI